MDDPFPVEALADARVAKQVDRPLLEHAGTNPCLAVRPAARLEDHRLDPGVLEQPRQGQPGRAGADDGDLSPQGVSSARTSCAIANARFAAGTPQ